MYIFWSRVRVLLPLIRRSSVFVFMSIIKGIRVSRSAQREWQRLFAQQVQPEGVTCGVSEEKGREGGWLDDGGVMDSDYI